MGGWLTICGLGDNELVSFGLINRAVLTQGAHIGNAQGCEDRIIKLTCLVQVIGTDYDMRKDRHMDSPKDSNLGDFP